jgi:hypothetical protein
MQNLGNINYDNVGLQPNILPKVTATTGISTLSASLLTDDGTTLKYNGNAVAGGASGLTPPTTIYSAGGTPLPAATAALKGARAVVSDATTPTFLGAYVSGGAVVAPVLCIGTGWVTA